MRKLFALALLALTVAGGTVALYGVERPIPAMARGTNGC
jgi:hypothetical protein